MKRITTILFALSLCAACRVPQWNANAPSSSEPTPQKPVEPAVLYGRNGKPVEDPAPTHGAASGKDAQANGGRLTILELYQKTLDERDALVRDLDLARAELDKTKASLADAQKQLDDQKARGANAEQDLDRLRAENLELAGRLATAHIRRMEAEKELLETKLEAAKAKAAAQADAKSNDAKSDSRKP